jgi:Flp pilus assembly pilin Flp
MLSRFISEEEGVTATEYGMMAALIGVVSIASLVALRAALQTTFAWWSANLATM